MPQKYAWDAKGTKAKKKRSTFEARETSNDQEAFEYRAPIFGKIGLFWKEHDILYATKVRVGRERLKRPKAKKKSQRLTSEIQTAITFESELRFSQN
ncbi:hypothetical protein KI387_005370 [Taxus chinensis]|uniref:Uncharacterized protein n=1 Tax=Taxus chinensis TaxID=29808 RepID=A0AA38LL61_TAXCH|nr:hypothetical protein KI387_005370 [Taxus chinensis]